MNKILHGFREFIKDNIYKVCPNCQDLIKDYDFMADQVSEVYVEVTGGRMSKPNYFAKDVIAESNDYNEKHYKEYYRSDIDDILTGYRLEGDPLIKELIEELDCYLEIDKDYIEKRNHERALHRLRR